MEGLRRGSERSASAGVKRVAAAVSASEHGRRKRQCKRCGGSDICAHGRQKYSCKDCGGSSTCTDGRNKSTCKECGGSRICSHGRITTTCKECGGGALCTHGKRKSRCKECGGSGFCAHGAREDQTALQRVRRPKVWRHGHDGRSATPAKGRVSEAPRSHQRWERRPEIKGYSHPEKGFNGILRTVYLTH
jgi:hypothetical protein